MIPIELPVRHLEFVLLSPVLSQWSRALRAYCLNWRRERSHVMGDLRNTPSSPESC
jgi:hypothetical protein